VAPFITAFDCVLLFIENSLCSLITMPWHLPYFRACGNLIFYCIKLLLLTTYYLLTGKCILVQTRTLSCFCDPWNSRSETCYIHVLSGFFSDLLCDTVCISDYITSNDGMTVNRLNVKDFEVIGVLSAWRDWGKPQNVCQGSRCCDGWCWNWAASAMAAVRRQYVKALWKTK
jgi:hypothetical protein